MLEQDTNFSQLVSRRDILHIQYTLVHLTDSNSQEPLNYFSCGAAAAMQRKLADVQAIWQHVAHHHQPGRSWDASTWCVLRGSLRPAIPANISKKRSAIRDIMYLKPGALV